jgi:transposase-like protein
MTDVEKLIDRYKTISEVARRLDTDRSTVYRWTEGKPISRAFRIRISNLLEKKNDKRRANRSGRTS